MTASDVAARLALARSLAGLTQEQLAAASGRPRDYVAAVETRRILAPRAASLVHLASALGVSLAWLQFGVGPGPQDPAALDGHPQAPILPPARPEDEGEPLLTAHQLLPRLLTRYGEAPGYIAFRRLVESGGIPSVWNPFCASRRFRDRRFVWSEVVRALDQQLTRKAG